jgi:hypothetical protein
MKENKMKKKNCWEVRECGREQGGKNVEALGQCPATLHNEYDAVNGGKHCGRFCWAVAGTYCKGEVQGIYSKKIFDCMKCEFFKQVEKEEGQDYIFSPQKAIIMREMEEKKKK